MHYEYFDCRIDDGIARVSFCGGGAGPVDLADEFIDLMLRLQTDNAVRAIVLDDEEQPFGFGASRRRLAEERPGSDGPRTLSVDLEVARRVVTCCHEMAKPIVAAVSGDVRDDGFGFFMAADVRLAADTAVLTPPDLGDGLLPDWGVSHVLPRLVGPGRSLELLWSGRSLDAADAYAFGLVDRLVESDRWEEDVTAFARRLASLPQPAVHLSKLASQQYTQFDLTSMLAYEHEAQQQCWNGRETNEGLDARLEDRERDFSLAPPDDE